MTKQITRRWPKDWFGWWKAAAASADVAEREKQASDAKQYAAQRFNDYVTGFTQLPEYGARHIFRARGRGIDWR